MTLKDVYNYYDNLELENWHKHESVIDKIKELYLNKIISLKELYDDFSTFQKGYGHEDEETLRMPFDDAEEIKYELVEQFYDDFICFKYEIIDRENLLLKIIDIYCE